MKRLGLFALLATVILSSFVGFGQQGPSRAAKAGVYVIGFRTPGHVSSSSPDVFHSAMSDVRKLLGANKVPLVADPERGSIENESKMSVESMTKLAAEAGATTLLQVIVDRPFTKWIKITLRSYDLDGKLLWEQSVDGGTGGMTGAGGYKKCFDKLEKILLSKAGGPGLPLSTANGAVAEVKQ